MGDLHADSKAFDEERLKKWVGHISEFGGNAIAVCVGDYFNGQTPGHKHFDAGAMRDDYVLNLEGYVKHALGHCERMLKPLTKAGVNTVLIEGNHDRMISAVGFTAMLSDRIGGTYLGNAGFIRAHCTPLYKTTGTPISVLYAHHGKKGGVTPGPKVNAMQALIGPYDADVYIAGHVHDAMLRVVNRRGVRRKGSSTEMVSRAVGLYRAPSFLSDTPTGYSTYGERNEYGANDSGLMWLEVNPKLFTMQRHELL